MGQAPLNMMFKHVHCSASPTWAAVSNATVRRLWAAASMVEWAVKSGNRPLMRALEKPPKEPLMYRGIILTLENRFISAHLTRWQGRQLEQGRPDAAAAGVAWQRWVAMRSPRPQLDTTHPHRCALPTHPPTHPPLLTMRCPFQPTPC
jgi:hypothetical protein